MSQTHAHEKSFFATLFDFGFTSFITLRFLKAIYAIVVALVLLGGLISLIYGLSSGTALGVIFGLILAPLGTLVYLVLARIGLEVVAMFFRIGDNTAEAVELLGGRQRPLSASASASGVAVQPPPAPPVRQPPVQQQPWDRPAPSAAVPPLTEQPLDAGQPTTVLPVQPPAPAPHDDEGWGPTSHSG